MRNFTIIKSKTVFIITLVVIVLTIFAVWVFGLSSQKKIIENSFWSTTILSTLMFLFLSIGLYLGVKLKDDIGKMTDRLTSKKFKEFTKSLDIGSTDVGSGTGGILEWIAFAVFIIFAIVVFGTLLWAMTIIIGAVLYWLFFRATRLVFKKSSICKGNLVKSISYAFGYTMLYNFWFYAILIIVTLIKK
ncbi:MAG: hypothetical protein EOP00_07760 [Pedobacter sp.]|nr:MAG: hypothetical protein EOP00_07760 [Pedobacter sp.]